jgi:hypothetical protein
MDIDEDRQRELSAFVDDLIFDLMAQLADIKDGLCADPGDAPLSKALDQILDRLNRIDEILAKASKRN